MLWNDTLMVDIHAFDNVPIGESYKAVGDAILADQDITRIVAAYGGNELKCGIEELHLILQLTHSKAFRICMEHYRDHNLMPREEVDAILRGPDLRDLSDFPFERINEFESDESRRLIAILADNEMNDIMELQMIMFGLQKPGFSYGEQVSDSEDEIKRAKQHRNWMALMVDFPKMYISQLKEMIYPSAFFVCFSGKNDDSAMWGNYADHHKGVCFVYDADYEEGKRNVGYYQKETKLCPKKVEYDGDVIERNFFETFGRLTIPQIESWLTGKDGKLSKCFEVFRDKESTDNWRNRYWEAFMAKNYRKLQAWSYEDEYRIHIENTFYEYPESDSENAKNTGKRSRNLKYDPKILKGVIFGIKSSEYDKARIAKALSEQNMIDNVEFYQADFDEVRQKVVVRKKGLWEKLSRNGEEK